MQQGTAPAECVPAGWERNAATGKLRPVKGEVREQRRGAENADTLARACPRFLCGWALACTALLPACVARSGLQTGDRRALRAPPGAVVLVR